MKAQKYIIEILVDITHDWKDKIEELKFDLGSEKFLYINRHGSFIHDGETKNLRDNFVYKNTIKDIEVDVSEKKIRLLYQMIDFKTKSEILVKEKALQIYNNIFDNEKENVDIDLDERETARFVGKGMAVEHCLKYIDQEPTDWCEYCGDKIEKGKTKIGGSNLKLPCCPSCFEIKPWNNPSEDNYYGSDCSTCNGDSE